MSDMMNDQRQEDMKYDEKKNMSSIPNVNDALDFAPMVPPNNNNELRRNEPMTVQPTSTNNVINMGSTTNTESAKSKGSLPVRAYLDQTVVPILLQALSQLVKERPESDPVEWLCHWMLRNNPNKNQ